ncbi:hypothetical protein [Burkholderia sp. HI2500]|uniref:hypothetical protein n=1 Tax=Burkholderia sp. HI2500 TaxID=2015358 RepID=UPI001180A5B0|nr:hypothetical protein [Burkholderia sp. HI2500]
MKVKISLIALVAALSSCPSLSTSAEGAGNAQIVTGDCNIVVNSATPKSFPAQYCPKFSVAKDAADALAKIEIYIEASNPTKLDLASAKIEKWASDSEDYLTLSLSNTSTLPAQRVKIRFLAPVNPGENQSHQINFSPSRAVPSAMLKSLSIGSKDTTKIPVAPVSELIRYSRNGVPADYEFIGAGTTPNAPDDMTQQYIQGHGLTNNYTFQSTASSLGVQILYGTIFGGKVSLLTGVYLYFGKVTANQPIDGTEREGIIE